MSDKVIDNISAQRVIVKSIQGKSVLPYIERLNVEVLAGVETNMLTLHNTSSDKYIKYDTVTLLSTTGTKLVSVKVLLNGVNEVGTYGAYGIYDTDKISIAELSIDDTLLSNSVNIVPGLLRNPEQIGGTLLDGQDNVRINLSSGDVALVAGPGEYITLSLLSEQNVIVSLDLRWSEGEEV